MKGGTKGLGGQGTRERFSSLADQSHLQILVKLNFVPDHGHIEFILEAT